MDMQASRISNVFFWKNSRQPKFVREISADKTVTETTPGSTTLGLVARAHRGDAVGFEKIQVPRAAAAAPDDQCGFRGRRGRPRLSPHSLTGYRETEPSNPLPPRFHRELFY